MNVKFTGASLAIIGAGVLAVAGIRRKVGAKNEAEDLVEFEKIDLGDRNGWILKERGDHQVIFTKDNDEWVVVSRNKNEPEKLVLRWEGGRDQTEAAREAKRKFGGVLGVPAQRRRTPSKTIDSQEKIKRTWKLVFDNIDDALAQHQEDQELARALNLDTDISDPAESETGFNGYVTRDSDGGFAYIYQAIHPHPRSAIVMNGSNNRESEEKKIRQAAKSAEIMEFNEWVKAVTELRGRPLTDADPYRPAIEASQGKTWYDVWLDRVTPEDAAKLGSRSVR